MDINRIYFIINEVLNAYIAEGVKPEHFLSFLNTDEENYKFIYNKIYRQLNLEEVRFESDVLSECLQDSIRDKIAMMNDMSIRTNESYMEMEKIDFMSLTKWKKSVIDKGFTYKMQSPNEHKYWIAFSNTGHEVMGFFTVDGEFDENSTDYTGKGYIII